MTPMDNTHHLTSEQMDVLLFAQDGKPASHAAMHLQQCAACSAELAEMRASLGMFREATTGFAERQRPRTNLLSSRSSFERGGFRSVPAYFALAASLAVAAVVVPLVRPLPKPQVALPAPPVVHNVETDDALLMEIDQQLDASLPPIMEPLADPTEGHRKHASPKTTDTKED